MQYSNAIVTATSRPLNKKSAAVSRRIRLTITADLRPQIRSPHTSLHVHCSRQGHGGINITPWAALVGTGRSHRTAQCHLSCWRADSQR